MKSLTKKEISIALKIITIVLVVVGVIAQTFNSLLVSRGLTSFLYFTTQSNVILGVTMGLLLFFELKNKEKPRWLIIFSHIAVSAVFLTFIVFSLFLGPFITGIKYFYSIQNLALHNFAPICGIIAYLLMEEDIPKVARPLALISGISYAIVTYILYFAGVSFGKYELPYFFLDFNTYGFLRINFPDFGVVYWWILIAIFLYGISVLLMFIRKLAHKNEKVPLTSFIFLSVLATIFIVFNIIIKL